MDEWMQSREAVGGGGGVVKWVGWLAGWLGERSTQRCCTWRSRSGRDARRADAAQWPTPHYLLTTLLAHSPSRPPRSLLPAVT